MRLTRETMQFGLAGLASRTRSLPVVEARTWFPLVLACVPYWLEALFHDLSGLTDLKDVLFWAILPLLSLVILIALLVTNKTSRLLLRIRSLKRTWWQSLAAGIILIAAAAYLWFDVMATFGQARNLYGILLFWMGFVIGLAIIQAHMPNALLLTVVVTTGLVSFQVVQYNSLSNRALELERTLAGYTDRYDYGLANPNFYPFLVFDAQPALPIPTLTDLVGSATTDAEVVQNVVSYYNTHSDELRNLFQENNSDRLKSLYVMYLINNVHAYGVDTIYAENLIQFIHDETAVECALQAIYQSRLMDGFGLAWRSVGLGPLHNWLEVKIGDHWEVFDASSNVWVDQGYDELLKGKSRRYRFFYAPWHDEARPDARVYAQEQQQDGYFSAVPLSPDYNVYYGGVGIQRALTPGIGIYYPPPLYCVLPDSSCGFYIVDSSDWPYHAQQ